MRIFVKKEYKIFKEYIVINDVLIQFIPVDDELEKEAVEKATTVKFKNVSIKIIKPEYLIAIFLKVYRAKDREKIIKLLEQAKIDKSLLTNILRKYGLDEKFREFVKNYYE
ncbi:MAG: hypothetical protein RMJ67_05870 [Elusimicrobiota bacterium]|nr:hypothetical protein [Endomicrobiia bacterium]MDW8166019.1 hypothetical protein [Elusimicrobiota bacterium]